MGQEIELNEDEDEVCDSEITMKLMFTFSQNNEKWSYPLHLEMYRNSFPPHILGGFPTVGMILPAGPEEGSSVIVGVLGEGDFTKEDGSIEAVEIHVNEPPFSDVVSFADIIGRCIKP